MENNKEVIRVGNRLIGEKHPTYIIAEIGLNHQGDVVLAKKLIDLAVQAGADCVKFQKRSLEKLYKKDVFENPEKQERGLQYSMSHVFKCELTEDQMRELHRYSQEKGVDFICTPWDEDSLHFLSTLNIPAYKVGSPDMFNLPLIRSMVPLKKPLFISTGMSFVSEIEQVIEFLNAHNAQYVLLHCKSTYPAAPYEINLNFLKKLAEKSRYPIGYSGHEQGIAISAAAVALGARVIERHITLDKTMPGPDHRASLEPQEFIDQVNHIRLIESALGEPIRYPSRGEFLNRENLSKSLIIKRDLKKGDVLRYEDIGVQSPGHGTKPLKLDYFIGRSLRQDVAAHDYLLESHIDFYEPPNLNDMEIHHKWGVVVRMSDIDLLIKTNPTFVEVHLNDTDVIRDYVPTKNYDVNVTIHAPENYGDLQLDISSMDEQVRTHSVAFYNQALDHARRLKQFFKNRGELVKFVVHPGGFGISGPLTEHREILNNNLLDSLKRLQSEGFELLIENMPGCPLVFGGQWYHSNFMDADEIVAFSKRTGYGIVFDTSHGALYCNYYKKDFAEFTKTILPVTRHVHISDAAGFTGEGLKIGDGTIDFKMLLSELVKTDLTMLAEIWQGHKFGGEDFINAIRALKIIDPRF